MSSSGTSGEHREPSYSLGVGTGVQGPRALLEDAFEQQDCLDKCCKQPEQEQLSAHTWVCQSGAPQAPEDLSI